MSKAIKFALYRVHRPKPGLLISAEQDKCSHFQLRDGKQLQLRRLIIPRLYLSDYGTALDADKLEQLGITHVLSVIDVEPGIPECIPANNKLHVSIDDRMDVDILTHLDDTTDFIRAALAENPINKVLVHCFQGISRSATVVCAYLIATTKKDAVQSIAFVQAQRGIVCPNLGFRLQLEEYAGRFGITETKVEIPPKLSRLSTGFVQRLRQLREFALNSDINENLATSPTQR